MRQARHPILATLLVAGCLAAATLDDGLALYRAGRFADAEAAFGEVFAAQPDQLGARYWRARARAAQEQWADAAADFRAVLQQKGDSLPSRLGLAACLEQMGDADGARAEFQAVLAAEPTNATAVEGVARLQAARARTATPAASVARPAPVALPPAQPVNAAAEVLGPRIAIEAGGLPGSFSALLQRAGLEASSPQLLDYTFGSAPTDWEPTAGTWQVSSRFACDPSWSFFGGYSQGLASIWNKRQFAGDVVVEAYVSFRHGLPWNPISWDYRPADLCLTLCGDGENPASGYSFIYAGDEGSRTMIRKGAEVLASTSDPQFLSPSYSDARPSTEEFHRRWWQLVAIKRGPTLTFIVDGQQALQVEDPTPLDAGRIAIWTVHNGMMVARVRVAYQQELRRQQPVIVTHDPLPLPGQTETVAVAP